MRAVIALLLLLLPVSTACQRESGTPSRAEPPELAASGGERVPDGFVTRFTAPDGQAVELAYSQAWAALYGGGKMAIKLSAESGTLPGRSLHIYLDLSNRKPARLEELEGAWLTAFPPSADGFVYEPRAGDRATRRRAVSAAVSITSVSDDAIEGTFTADFGGGDAIADGAFRAARSPNLEPDSLAVLVQRSR